MMSSTLISSLSREFTCDEQSDWTAINTRSESLKRAFKTKRVAKLSKDELELQFTIGATETGCKSNLNGTIKALIVAKGLTVVMRRTTSGSRSSDGLYPTIKTKGVSNEALIGLALRVEAEATALSHKMPRHT